MGQSRLERQGKKTERIKGTDRKKKGVPAVERVHTGEEQVFLYFCILGAMHETKYECECHQSSK